MSTEYYTFKEILTGMFYGVLYFFVIGTVGFSVWLGVMLLVCAAKLLFR